MALLQIPDDLVRNDPCIINLEPILNQILQDLVPLGANRVCIRLNRSDRDYPSPIHILTVEADQMREQRRQLASGVLGPSWNEVEAGDYRFNEENPSVVYYETVSDRAGEVKERDWSKDFREKSQGAKALALKSGAKHQRYIAISVNDLGRTRHVGLLSAGFPENPDPFTDKIVRAALKHWAQALKSPLVQHLMAGFELGGPFV